MTNPRKKNLYVLFLTSDLSQNKDFGVERYPVNCDLCEAVLRSKSEVLVTVN